MSLFADDLAPGQVLPFGHHTLSEEEIVAFARQWDPISIHTDPDAARARGLDGVIASGLHTLGVYQRFVVEALWSQVAGGVGRSFQIRFRRPVRPGATLTGHATITSVVPRTERGDAVVAIDGELRDERGDVVLQIVNESVLPLRAGARPS
jgi:acyl dehydratase